VVLRALEGEHPAITGWILDEQTTIREHVSRYGRLFAHKPPLAAAEQEGSARPSVT
jgi:hypothetical protein